MTRAKRRSRFAVWDMVSIRGPGLRAGWGGGFLGPQGGAGAKGREWASSVQRREERRAPNQPLIQGVSGNRNFLQRSKTRGKNQGTVLP